MIEKTYKVNGMSCNHCVMHVKNAVTELSGVESCDVNLQQGSMTVRYNESKVDYSDLKEAVEEAGYEME
jgi:copper ion binding protein